MAITSNFFGLNLFNNIYSSSNDIGLNIRLQLSYSDPIFTTYDKSNLKFVLENNTLNTTNTFNFILDKYYGYSFHYIPISFKNYINNDFENNILDFTGNTAFTYINLLNQYTYYVYLNYFENNVEYDVLLSSNTFDVQFFEFNTALHNNLNYLQDKFTSPINLSDNKYYIDLYYGCNKNIILYLDSITSTLNLQFYDKTNTVFKTQSINVDYSGVGYYIYNLNTNDIEQRTEYLTLNGIRLILNKDFCNYDNNIFIAEYDTKFNSISNFIFEGKTDKFDVNNKSNILNNSFTKYTTIQNLTGLTNNYILDYRVDKNYDKTSYNRYECNTAFLSNYTYLDETFKELLLTKNCYLNEYNVIDLSGYTIVLSSSTDYTNTFEFTQNEVDVLRIFTPYTNTFPDQKYDYSTLGGSTIYPFDYSVGANNGSLVFKEDNCVYLDDSYRIQIFSGHFFDEFFYSAKTINISMRWKLIPPTNISYNMNNLHFGIRINSYNPSIAKSLDLTYNTILNNSVDDVDGWKIYNFVIDDVILQGSTYQSRLRNWSSFIMRAYGITSPFPNFEFLIDYTTAVVKDISPSTGNTYIVVDPCKKLELINTYDVLVEDGTYTLLNDESDSLISYNVKFRDKNKEYNTYDIK